MDCIEFQVNGVSGSSKRIAAFRGIPDNWIGNTRLLADGFGGVEIIKNYLAGAKLAALGLRVYVRGAAVRPITSISRDATSGLLQILAAGHGLPVPPTVPVVTLRRIKGNPMLNGRWKAIVVDANTFQLSGSGRFYANSSGEGTFQQFTATTDAIDTFDFARVATRRTGVPFGTLRGRRSARLRRA